MKRICIYPVLFVLFMFPSICGAGSFGTATGCLTTADACGFGTGFLGGFISYGDEATTIFGNISYGFSQYTEGRVMMGFSDPDFSNSDPAFLLGADVKYEVMDYYDKMNKKPLDAAFGANFELVNYDGFQTLELGGYVIGSIPYSFANGKKVIPYGRLILRWERMSFDADNLERISDFRLGLNAGAKFELMKDMNVYGEIQIDGNTGILLGIDFRAL